LLLVLLVLFFFFFFQSYEEINTRKTYFHYIARGRQS
jgi:hypothetical protein